MLWMKLPWFGRLSAFAGHRTAGLSRQPAQHIKPEVLCSELGQLVADMPSLELPLSAEAKEWLGIVYTLVLASGHTMEAASLLSKVDLMSSRVPEIGAQAQRKIVPILNSVLVMEKLRASAVQGGLLPEGRPLGALAAFRRVLPNASQDILIIDPYLDEKVLSDLAMLVLENVRLRLLAGEAQYKTALKPAAARWLREFSGTRPLEVRLAPRGLVHDRLISIDDGRQTWSLTQPASAVATRSLPSIRRVEPEVAALKVEAYENVWASAETL